jgi:hypothetical protein
MTELSTVAEQPDCLLKGSPGIVPSDCPLLLTEDELIDLLRIPEISKAEDYHHVIQNLMRMHDLPCIHISKTPLYPFEAVRQWIMEKVRKEQR